LDFLPNLQSTATRRDALARSTFSQESESPDPESSIILLSNILPSVLQEVLPPLLESNLTHLISILSDDIPIDISLNDLLQFSNFALDKFLEPAPLPISNLVMTALYHLQVRERELSNLLSGDSFLSFLAVQILTQTSSDYLSIILRVCSQFLLRDSKDIISYVLNPALTLFRHSDPIVITSLLNFLITVFESEIDRKTELSELVVLEIIRLLQQTSDHRILEAVSILFNAFLQAGICCPLIPRGVECYNRVLAFDDPRVLYRTLQSLVALLRCDGPQIEVLRDLLDWNRLIAVLTTAPMKCVSQALICFGNCASFGLENCRKLYEIGLLASLLNLMEGASFDLKVDALECFYPFVVLSDVASWVIFETGFVELVSDIVTGMKGLRLCLLMEKMGDLLGMVMGDGREGVLADLVLGSGFGTVLQELVESEVLVDKEVEAVSGVLQFLNDRLFKLDL
jgi:hypothetical protein